MQAARRTRMIVLAVFAALLVYPAVLVYRYIDLSGGSFTSDGARTALIETIRRDDLTMMHALLIVGVDPDRRPGDLEMPPLSVAAQAGKDRAVELLLEYGAHPDSAEHVFEDPFEIANMPPGAIRTFDRPMFRAAKNGHRKVVDVLRSHGARFEVWDAIFLADQDAVQTMISSSVEVAESIKKNGHDALAIAVNSDKFDAARLLLDLGVNPFEKRGALQSLYDFAVAGEHTEMVELLESYRTEALPAG